VSDLSVLTSYSLAEKPRHIYNSPVEAQFEYQLETRLSPRTAWDFMVASFQNSNVSPIWPKECSIVKIENDNFRNGAQVTMLYNLGITRTKVHYILGHINREKSFIYGSADTHPLHGGGMVLFEERPEGTRIVWKGRYQTKSFLSRLSLYWFRKFYEKKFFKNLERTFRKFDA
jgi:hypothetical protein